MNVTAGYTGLPAMLCKQGYGGVMCWNCVEGYGRSMSNQCVTCPSLHLLRLTGAALALSILALVIYTLKYSLRPREAGAMTTQQQPVATVKIFVNYVFSLSLLGAVDIDWGERLKTLFASSRTASGGAISFSDCFGLQFFSILRFYFTVVPACVVFLPMCLVGGSILLQLLVDTRAAVVPLTVLGHSPRACFRNGVIVMGYLAWPAISRKALEVLSCREVKGHGRVLTTDFSVECDTEEYRVWRGISWTLLLTLVPAFPLLVAFLVRRNRRAAMSEKRLGDEKFASKYAFLTAGFQSYAAYWETLVMLRKFLLTASIALCSGDARLQLLFFSLVANFGFGTHVVVQPYAQPWHTRLETATLSAVCLSAAGGILLVMHDSSSRDTLSEGQLVLIALGLYLTNLPLIGYLCFRMARDAANASASSALANSAFVNRMLANIILTVRGDPNKNRSR